MGLVAQFQCGSHHALVHGLFVAGKANFTGLGADGAALPLHQIACFAKVFQGFFGLTIALCNATALIQHLPVNLCIHRQLGRGQQLVKTRPRGVQPTHFQLGLVHHEGAGQLGPYPIVASGKSRARQQVVQHDVKAKRCIV